jgi:simple sugar transport system substrate-binding protein
VGERWSRRVRGGLGRSSHGRCGALMYFGQDEEVAGQAGGQRLSQEGATHVICIAPEQGNVSIDARCRGAKNDFPGKLETSM